ncbi:ATP-binding protein [Nocardioides sp. GCM10027113]|uniref:ATP-binding protein n=1 Tax=unclassified Nocardioides TaxID=2615069 RepID=UPI0036068E6E
MSNPTGLRRSPWTRWWPQRLGFALAFAVAGHIGRMTVVDGQSLSLVWPAAGVAVLWFLAGEVRLRDPDVPLLALIAFLVNRLTGAETDVALVFTATNTVMALLVASLLHRWLPRVWGTGGGHALASTRDVARFAAAAAAGALAGVGLGTLGLLAATGSVDPASSVVWFGRNLCGILAVSGLGVVLGQQYSATRSWRRVLSVGDKRRGEFLAALVTTVVTCVGVFAVDGLPLEFPLLVSTVWVGLRFSPALSITHSWTVGVLAVVLTLQGHGPFAEVQALQMQALLAQLFVVLMLMMGLLLAVGREEQAALTRTLAATERDARDRAELLRTIIGSIDQGLLVVDGDGAILLQNPAAATLTGAPVTRVGDLGWERADGSALSETEHPHVRALAGETTSGMDVTAPGSGGSRTLAVSAQPLQSRPGQPRRAVMVFRDVTDERQQQRELAAFAGVVAHDLLNPVTSVAGWAEVLEAELGDGDDLAQDAVRRVSRGVERMRQLISDLLTHARSKDGPLDLADLDLAALVEDVALARDTPYVTVDPDLAGVRADESLLRQVLDNLIGNGLKYVAPGTEPWVSVHAVRDRRDRGMVRVSVVDNGIGIPDEQRQQVFDEFHRAHADDYEGTGLGLAICRRIVERHGGSIGIESNHPSPGSTFWFTLPAAHRPVGRPASPATAAREPA